MGEIVNLNQARKARDKAIARSTAASNRALHGLTKAQKDAARADRDRGIRSIEGHRRDDQLPDSDPGQSET